MTKWVVEWQSCFHKEGEWSRKYSIMNDKQKSNLTTCCQMK